MGLVPIVPEAALLAVRVYLFSLEEKAFFLNLHWYNGYSFVDKKHAVDLEKCPELRLIVNDEYLIIFDLELSLLARHGNIRDGYIV